MSIRSIIQNFFLRYVVQPSKIEQLLNERKVMRCTRQVTIGEKSKFFEQAKVHNLSNDRGKILIGKNTHVRGELLLFAYGGEIHIGDNCYVGEGTRIWSGDRIFIGNDVLISHNVNIVDSNSHELNHVERSEGYKNLILHGHPAVKGSIITSPITINDHVWISFNVCLLKGVTVGEGAIVAAGSVVTKDVPAFTIVAGNPARVVKVLDSQVHDQ